MGRGQATAITIAIAALTGIYVLVSILGLLLLREEAERFRSWLMWYPLLTFVGIGALFTGQLAWLLFPRFPGGRAGFVGRFALTLCFLGSAILILIVVDFYVDPSSDESRATVAQIAAAIIGGLLVALGSYVAWQTLQVTRRRLELDIESGITQNFTATVDQLGSHVPGGDPNIDIRIGGLLALGAIADSWFERSKDLKQYWATIRVLAAYILENQKRWNQSRPDPTTGDRWELRSDIEVAIDVLGQRKDVETLYHPYEQPNLRGIDFERVETAGRDFRRCDLSAANFRKAVAPVAKFQCANLMYATFEQATLAEARFEGANLYGVFFSRMVLRHVSGRDRDARPFDSAALHLLQDEVLEAIPYTCANLKGTDFTGVDLRCAFGLDVAELVQARGVDSRLLPSGIRQQYIIQKEIHDSLLPDDCTMGLFDS